MTDVDHLEERMAPFKEGLADLVDALLGELEPDSAAAVHAAIAGGTTLRLAVNVAPAFAVSLYLVGAGGSPGIVIAGYGPAVPDVPRGTIAGPVH